MGLIGLLAGIALQAEVSLPAVFSDHAVLQRDKPVPVWGWADPGETVTVSLAGSEATAAADEAGRWRVDLPAMEAGGPHTLTVRGSSTITVTDLLVGDVWVCSGQSNMEWPLRAAETGAEVIPTANHPNLRFIRIGHRAEPLPREDVDAAWAVSTPETVANLTAVGFFFGRELHSELDVPIGLIDSNWGGTRVEPWTPPQGFESVEGTAAIHERVMLALPTSEPYKARLEDYLAEVQDWLDQSRTAMTEETPVAPRPAFPSELTPLTRRTDPTALYNGMIHAVVPFAIKGVIWYQGESNRLDGHLYADKMRALVKGWREVWAQDAFPFYYVQLAPFVYRGLSPRLLPRIWEAQTQALDLPNTGMVVINDIGNLRDIHPRNKRDVGHRLARMALAKTYDRTDGVWSSPFLEGFRIDGSRVILTFNHVGEGLKRRDGEPLSWFEVVGPDGSVVKAQASIESADTVVVSAEGVDEPVGVRFAWDQAAEPNLVNSAGLPAGAFRAGDVGPHNPIATLTPLAKGYHTVYQLDIPENCNYSDKPVEYDVDNSSDITVPFDRVGYCLELQQPDGPLRYVFVSMAAFTDDIRKIGVPTVARGGFFQQNVERLEVASNVDGMPTGVSLGTGFLEFWPSSYGPQNDRGVPGASSEAFDFGDGGARPGRKGYGSMQVHVPSKKTTLFAFNRWGPAGNCELGIGNNPAGNPDWTFTGNAATYTLRRLTVLVRIDR